MRVETNSCHHQEVALDRSGICGEQPDTDPSRDPIADLPCDVFSASAETQLGRQHVRRAGGQDAERNVFGDHPVGHFVDGAVSACDEDQIGAAAHELAGDTGRRPGPFGSYSFDTVTRPAEVFQRAVNPPDSRPIEAARRGIVDEKCVPVDGDVRAPESLQL